MTLLSVADLIGHRAAAFSRGCTSADATRHAPERLHALLPYLDLELLSPRDFVNVFLFGGSRVLPYSAYVSNCGFGDTP
ncbi:uncharacterized protein K460DRAFT_57751 [Cucurbitaria berberidis CBS 394.84]|uniref:Uncharacterized protein n=1 Tax=Cucurbitaria berberidis CBS 394.84 TaxID=1168544 RepID=A0A9P4LAI8_9PLEO|nr:uncharacterized protein K460DRAFT_57751 [Cucurbitaria berberidis CBS 394.84]KAF1847402.1 hypothetical protein K460DRAFT_57751 [Cucurbitaria berberidis CBS 394.84]